MFGEIVLPRHGLQSPNGQQGVETDMNTEVKRAEPTQNDRIMAALAHATAVLPFTGLIAPIVIWVTQRDKSEYVAFQALQAIVYQLGIIVAWFAGMALYMGTFLLVIPFGDSSSRLPPFFFVPFAVMGLMMLGMLAAVIYALIAAAMALQGKDFHYLVIGQALKRFLQPK